MRGWAVFVSFLERAGSRARALGESRVRRFAAGRAATRERAACPRGRVPACLVAAIVFIANAAFAQTLTITGPLFTEGVPFTVTGTAAPNAQVAIAIGDARGGTAAGADGRWSLTWTAPPLKSGTYDVTATSNGESATQILRVQLPLTTNLQRESGIETPPVYGAIEMPNPDAAMAMTDRWRIVPPPYEIDEHSRGKFDPYNQNRLKGDFPIRGRQDLFFVFTGVSDTLAESRTLPTPSGVSTERPASLSFFGRDNQNLFNQNVDLSFDLFQGDTAFRPVIQRVKVTLVGNLNSVHVREDAIVKPDVRRGTSRTDGYLALQEFFYERKLRDLSPNYDFVSVRVGSQPFSSDFRGFIFSDTNLGVRVFGNYASNRIQYNLALFDRFEKDTNSGLNIFHEFRDQQVAIANAYIQDFLVKGYTQEFSLHYVRDGASSKYDRNGNLVRPAPVGDVLPHSIHATYLGMAGLGHVGRFNLDDAVYYVFGHDSINPIAGNDPLLRSGNAQHISAGMAALEVSYDHDWFRPHVSAFFATGDRNPRDRDAHGFDAIFDSPNFAGGGFSFFNRLGIRLPDSGVSLVERGSLLPTLRSSKEEGQLNFVNPGVLIGSAGVDVDVTPRLVALFNASYIRLGTSRPIEQVLFQDAIHTHLGEDISLGVKWRPYLNNNVIVVGGVAGFLPGQGFKDIYESGKTLYHFFTNLILTF